MVIQPYLQSPNLLMSSVNLHQSLIKSLGWALLTMAPAGDPDLSPPSVNVNNHGLNSKPVGGRFEDPGRKLWLPPGSPPPPPNTSFPESLPSHTVLCPFSPLNKVLPLFPAVLYLSRHIACGKIYEIHTSPQAAFVPGPS